MSGAGNFAEGTLPGKQGDAALTRQPNGRT